MRNEQQGLAASLFQTSFQVGGAVVLAVVTAVVDAGGASRLTSPAATLGAYRPALYLITACRALGAVTALSGLRSARRQVRPSMAPVPVPALTPLAEAVPAPALATDVALATRNSGPGDEAGAGRGGRPHHRHGPRGGGGLRDAALLVT